MHSVFICHTLTNTIIVDMNFFLNVIRDISVIMYPDHCPSCKQNSKLENHQLCFNCISDLPFTDHFNSRHNNAFMKFLGRQKLVHAWALFNMTIPGPTHQIIQAFKYQNNTQLGSWCGELLGEKISKMIDCKSIDWLIPVPIHKTKRSTRGYNQTEIIAEAISSKTGIPVRTDLLSKSLNNNSQTSMSRGQRIENTLDSFKLLNSKIQDCHLLLIDDVLTTGATLEACMILLRKIPHVRISIAIIAMTKT